MISNEYVLERIDWTTIYKVWSERLWPNRPNIRPYTPMINATEYDMNIHKRAKDNWMYHNGVFWGIRYLPQNKIIGVNSGHQCNNKLFRSRGLFVYKDHTRKGLAQILLQATIDFAREKDFEKIWSYPRDKAIPTYKAVGYEVGKPHEHEAYITADGVQLYRWNAYAELML
jgi:GNAT superfamily N-acetyltransferase